MAGIPYTPLSVAYSTMSGDLGKLRAILDVLDPGLVFAADAAPFARALAIEEMRGREIVLGRDHGSVKGAISLASLLATPVDEAVLDRAQKLPAQTIAKILFTSGSTGTPKGVPTTHRMMCTSLSQIEALWPFMREPHAGAARLVALEPRVRWIVQRQQRAALWRHALHRRRQACSRRDRADPSQSARGAADTVLERSQGIRAAAAAAGERCVRAAEFLRRSRLDVLCRRQPAGAAVAGIGGAGKARHRPRHSDDHELGPDRDRTLDHHHQPRRAGAGQYRNSRCRGSS